MHSSPAPSDLTTLVAEPAIADADVAELLGAKPSLLGGCSPLCPVTISGC
jgi:hypothetical protein